MSRRLRVSTAVAAAALAVAAGVNALSDARGADSTYVAMGDSYSSGAKIAPVIATKNPRCGQSQVNYARLIVQRTEVSGVTDVSCSGARTSHFRLSQHPGVAPQMDALSEKTRLVTMTLGANDRRVFGESLTACVAAASRDRAGNPCERRFGSMFQRRIDRSTYPNLVRTLGEVRKASPQARVAIVGYPRIFPDQGTPACTRATHIAQGDIAYLNQIQVDLNRAVRRAASATGVRFVDMSQVSRGRDACQSADRRWVEPFVPINASSFHPNAKGESAMATQIIDQLRLTS